MSSRSASAEMQMNAPAGRRSHRRLLGLSVAVASTVGAAIFAAPPALAHDAVISSRPSDNQVLAEFPHSISLEFSGNPRENFNTIAVSDADAKEVLYTHEPEVSGNIVTLEIPDDVNPGPGNYIIGFQITSSDGHSTRGKTSFSVSGDSAAAGAGVAAGVSDSGAADAAEAGAETVNTGARADDKKSIPTWAYWLGGGLVVIIAATVTVINRKAK